MARLNATEPSRGGKSTATKTRQQKLTPLHKALKQQQQSRPKQQDVAQIQKLSDSSLLKFEREGFLVTRGLLPQQQLQQVRSCIDEVVQQRRLEALKHRVRVLCPGYRATQQIKSEAHAMSLIRQRGNSELGFLQFFNLHRSQPLIAALVRHKHLTTTAAQLLGVKRLRLYQDCVFLKEPGYAETNWHSDLRMAPLDTNAFVTAWIPLRPISGAEGDSGLLFAKGSHRDFALPFWHDMRGRDLEDRGYELQDTGPMSVGDVSWHHGWTLHCASPQPPNTPPRLALMVGFFADGARLLPRTSDPSVFTHMLHDEDAESYGSWLGEVKDGAVAWHAALPLVHPCKDA